MFKSQELDSVDLLVIDVRGAELEVLETLRTSRVKPRFIVFEDDLDDRHSRVCVDIMASLGYRYICGRTDKVFGLDV